MYDVERIRADFPILSREVNGKPLVYLDNGASAQKPQAVIDAVTRGYAEEYSNVHRGLHYLSNLATDKYEAVRGTIARFPRRQGRRGRDRLYQRHDRGHQPGRLRMGHAAHGAGRRDRAVHDAEHHANIVPWHFLRERHGRGAEMGRRGFQRRSRPQAVIAAITPKTKLVAVTHMSNVLGTVVDVQAITRARMKRACRCWSMAASRRCTCR